MSELTNRNIFGDKWHDAKPTIQSIIEWAEDAKSEGEINSGTRNIIVAICEDFINRFEDWVLSDE